MNRNLVHFPKCNGQQLIHFIAGSCFLVFSFIFVLIIISAFAFLLFGVSEFIEVVEDVESHEGPFSINEIRDYFIIGAIALFAIGTIVRIKK